MPSGIRGADFNAFGYDPKGHKAYISSLFYGPDWVPDIPGQQFGGPPEPPRYGPPAKYQCACLPKGWKARAPADLYNCGGPMPPFFPPPKVYNPHWCAALLVSKRFLAATEESDSDESDIPTSPVDPGNSDLEKEDEDGSEYKAGKAGAMGNSGGTSVTRQGMKDGNVTVGSDNQKDVNVKDEPRDAAVKVEV